MSCDAAAGNVRRPDSGYADSIDGRRLLWLVVDDDEASRELARAVLASEGFDVITAIDGFDALAVAGQRLPDVVLSDVLMPRMDGFVLCMHWQSDPVLRSVPFIFCAADYMDPADHEFAMSLGAAGYFIKPLAHEQIHSIAALTAGRPTGPTDRAPVLPDQALPDSVSLETLRRYNARLFSKLEQKVSGLEDTTRRLKEAMDGCLAVIGSITEARDPYTLGHEQRVAELAVAIAQKMGIDDDGVETVRIAAMLHDVGKIAVPSEILSKPGLLSAVEREMVRAHAAAGGQMLELAQMERPIKSIVVQHHERLDGSGYPAGLRAKDILLESRIIAVVDVVEAMASPRPYRPALNLETALDEVRTHAGTLYDAEVVATCLDLFESEGFTFSEAATLA